MSEILPATASSLNPLTAGIVASFGQSDSQSEASIGLLYEGIVCDPRYFQFARIPDRIIQCLELCGISCDHERARERLRVYYFFIGVVDDEIDCARLDVGEKILKRLANPIPSFDEETRNSRAQFMTEILKQHLNPTNSQVLRKFRRLHKANVTERNAPTMRAYVKQRKLVGRLTAELSYLLIRDHLLGDSSDVRRLMKEVGAVGCLVDSIVDAASDKRAGLMSFRPTYFDSVFLFTQTFLLGMRITLKHPRLVPLFVEAIRDNFYDRRRSYVE